MAGSILPIKDVLPQTAGAMVVPIQVVLVALSPQGPVLVSTDLRDGKISLWSHVAQSVERGAEKKTTMLIEADLISIVVPRFNW